jgi:hypothetical protein
MSPTCSNVAMRALISIMLATSIANAAALPHQVLDARDAAPIQNAQLAAQAIQAAASAAAENPTNFFKVVSEQLNNRTAWEVIRDFFARLFEPRDDDNDNDNDNDNNLAPVTITVTPTPADATSPVTSVIEIILPAGPSATPTEVVVSAYPSTTPAPASESEIMFSILPVGDMTSAINATFLTPIFVTESETPSATEIVAPFPIANATSSDYGSLPTAASITGMFSTNPLVTDVPSPANSSAPAGTGVALPVETVIPVNVTVPLFNITEPLVNITVPLLNITEPLVNITVPLLNITEPLADNATSVTVVVVTETVTPVPILSTGTAPAVSAGTGLPIIILGSPLWPNASYGEPTAVVLPLGTGTGLPLGTGIPIPLETGATAVLPLGTGIPIPLGTGATAVLPIATAVSYGTDLGYGTGVSYGTGIPLVTGTGDVAVPTIAASPLYPNTTYNSEPSSAVLSIPILATGVPDPVFINVTIPTANISSTADALEGTVTEIPIIVTGVPGSVIDISFTIPAGPYANVSAEDFVATTEAPVSVGTGLPIAASVDVSAPFANATVSVVTTETQTATAVLILPPAVVETPIVDAGQLNVTVVLPTGGYGRK